MTNAFVETFMSTFGEQVKKDAEAQMNTQSDHYKKRLDKIQQNNGKILEETMNIYTQKQNQLGKRMSEMITKKVTESNRKIRNEISMINDELFNDPKQLYEKIKKATTELEKTQKDFNKEKQIWLKDEKRISEWLGKPTELKDDNKEGFGSDFITIKVDERTFRTYRKTLTQVEGSKIAKLFSGTCEDKQLIPAKDKSNMFYTVNYNGETFAQVLEILRNKGKIDFDITAALHVALVEFGILNRFFPSFNSNSLVSVSNSTDSNSLLANMKGYHVVFEVYRSTALANSYYPKWNKKILSSTEKKEDYVENWQLNPQDESEIMFLKTGYYRITFRFAINYSSHAYVQMYVDGSGTDVCYRYAASANNIRSYYFNDIRQFTEGQKLKFYVSTATMYAEEQSTYLCIERIPENILPSVGIWQCSTSTSNYRNWNKALKTSDRYTIKSSYNLSVNRGGLYRVSARVHSNYGAAGNRYMYMNEYRNGSAFAHQTWQSSASTNYQCHMFDEICSLKRDDYVNIYAGGYGTVSSYPYDCIQIQYIPFPDMIGYWRSASIQSTYQRAWDNTTWCNEMLYSLNNTKNIIEVKQDGYYRISSQVTQQTTSSQAGHSALYINGSQYCLARYGAAGSTYLHTTTIQEIVKLNKGDKFYIYVHPKPYDARDYNSLYIEKLY
eukprot:288375_1